MSHISFRTNDYMYSYLEIPPPDLKIHLHNYYEFLYFKQGDASYMVEDQTYPITEGDIFITRPHELHTPVFHSQKRYVRHFIQISPAFLSGLDIDLLYFINHRELGQYNRIPAEIVKQYDLAQYFSKVEYYIVHRLPESDLMIKTYMIQMLVTMNTIFKALKADAQIYKPSNDRITAIEKYISENLSSEISLDTLAEKFFINKYYMCHTFKEETGLTIKEYINTRRISKAKQLLNQGYNITDLCFSCGFNDYSTFYKTFKKFTGKSPRAFLNPSRQSKAQP